MDLCNLVRESLSALADGEQPALGSADCDAHLAGCRDCATFASGLPSLVRATRLHEAASVPDLTARVLGAAAGIDAEAERERQGQLRWVLGVTGAAQAVLAVVELLVNGGHLSRELATWQLALGVGFAVAAWQPVRARGLMPMVAVLGLAAVVSATGDLIAGATTVVAELGHLVEVAGVVLVWAVARLSADDPAADLVASP